MNYFWFNQTLSKSIEEPRFHHQLLPNYIRLVKGYLISPAIQEGLKRLGHTFKTFSTDAMVQAVAISPDGKLYGKADPRKHSWAAGF